jgi:hypothetical protein
MSKIVNVTTPGRGTSYGVANKELTINPFTWGRILNPVQSAISKDRESEMYDAIRSMLSGSAADYWDDMSKYDKRAVVDHFLSTDDSEGYHYYDIDAIADNLNDLNSLSVPTLAAPNVTDYIDSAEDIYAKVDASLNPRYAQYAADLKSTYDADVKAIDDALAALEAESLAMRDTYQNELSEELDFYNNRASNLMANQYRANAQTYDALQSDLRKSRQNALEAGASAGMRIAGNINSLLSAQNKQSQTAMDTSNALAEMLLQQRQAAAGIRSEYSNYMREANAQKSGYGIDKANALSDYKSKLTDLDMQKYADRESQYNNIYSGQQHNYDRALANYDSSVNKFENNVQTMISSGNPYVSGYQSYMQNKK